MKKIIRWLAKIFNAEITVTKIVENEVFEGNITVKGNLDVEGYIHVTGNISCREIKK